MGNRLERESIYSGRERDSGNSEEAVSLVMMKTSPSHVPYSCHDVDVMYVILFMYV